MGGVAKAVKKAVDTVVDTVEKVVKTVAKAVQDVVKFAGKLVEGVINVIETGNVTDLISLAFAAMSGPGGLILWATVRIGIPAITSAAADMGWISQETAMYINIAASVAAIVYGRVTNSFAGYEFTNTASTLAIDGLKSLGVSAATANNIVQTASMIGSYASIGYQAYGIYQTIQNVKDLQMQYLAAVAAFEAWKADLERAKSVSEGNHIEAMSFATGEYYKRLPGQDLYNIFMPGREAYVCMEAVMPAYWVENRMSPFTADREIVSMTWDEFLPLEDRFGLK